MVIRQLLAVIAALALWTAPAIAAMGEAVAAPSDHHAQMMATGHCETPSSDPSGEEHPPTRPCCHSASMPVALCPAAPLSFRAADGGVLPTEHAIPSRDSRDSETDPPPPRRS